MPYCRICKGYRGTPLEAFQCANEDLDYRVEFRERRRQAGLRVALEDLSKLSKSIDAIYERRFGVSPAVDETRIRLMKAFDRVLRPTPIDEAEARVEAAFDKILRKGARR